MAQLSKMLGMTEPQTGGIDDPMIEEDWQNFANRYYDWQHMWNQMPREYWEQQKAARKAKREAPKAPWPGPDEGKRAPVKPPQDPVFNPTWPQAKSPDEEGYWPDPQRPHITLNGQRHYLDELPQSRWEGDEGVYISKVKPGMNNRQGRSYIQQGDEIIYLDPVPGGTMPAVIPDRYRPKSRDL